MGTKHNRPLQMLLVTESYISCEMSVWCQSNQTKKTGLFSLVSQRSMEVIGRCPIQEELCLCKDAHVLISEGCLNINKGELLYFNGDKYRLCKLGWTC